MILPKNFYNRPTLKVAREILGCFLVVLPGGKSPAITAKRDPAFINKNKSGGTNGTHANEVVLPGGKSVSIKRTDKNKSKKMKFKIVEVEAYVGPSDLASHASRGLTERNRVMFGEPGRIYVYFTYGMHYMLNIVTQRAGYPAAVLIRAVESPPPHEKEALNTNGPAKLTKYLRIDKSFNGLPIYVKKYGLWIEDRKEDVGAKNIVKTTRVGVDYAQKYREKLWRFYIKGSHFISRK